MEDGRQSERETQREGEGRDREREGEGARGGRDRIWCVGVSSLYYTYPSETYGNLTNCMIGSAEKIDTNRASEGDNHPGQYFKNALIESMTHIHGQSYIPPCFSRLSYPF